MIFELVCSNSSSAQVHESNLCMRFRCAAPVCGLATCHVPRGTNIDKTNYTRPIRGCSTLFMHLLLH
jgi:hypothetical protein